MRLCLRTTVSNGYFEEYQRLWKCKNIFKLTEKKGSFKDIRTSSKLPGNFLGPLPLMEGDNMLWPVYISQLWNFAKTRNFVNLERKSISSNSNGNFFFFLLLLLGRIYRAERFQEKQPKKARSYVVIYFTAKRNTILNTWIRL